jgi:hypothetical protein
MLGARALIGAIVSAPARVEAQLAPAGAETQAAYAPSDAKSSAGRVDAQEDHAASRTIGDTTFMLPALADSAFVLTEFGPRPEFRVDGQRPAGPKLVTPDARLRSKEVAAARRQLSDAKPRKMGSLCRLALDLNQIPVGSP